MSWVSDVHGSHYSDKIGYYKIGDEEMVSDFDDDPDYAFEPHRKKAFTNKKQHKRWTKKAEKQRKKDLQIQQQWLDREDHMQLSQLQQHQHQYTPATTQALSFYDSTFPNGRNVITHTIDEVGIFCCNAITHSLLQDAQLNNVLTTQYNTLPPNLSMDLPTWMYFKQQHDTTTLKSDIIRAGTIVALGVMSLIALKMITETIVRVSNNK